MPGSSRKEVQIFLGKHEIKIDSQLRLIVDGQVEEVKPEQWTQVKKIAQVFRSQNQVLEISAPYYTLSLTFDGETLAVQTSQYVKVKILKNCKFCWKIIHPFWRVKCAVCAETKTNKRRTKFKDPKSACLANLRLNLLLTELKTIPKDVMLKSLWAFISRRSCKRRGNNVSSKRSSLPR